MSAARPPAERVRLGPIENPVRGLLHGGAALLALGLAARFALGAGPEGGARLALLAFALGHAGLFGVSALYHAVPWPPLWKGRMQRADHSMIYVGIAATLTPVALLGAEGRAGTLVLAAAWGIALLGAAQKAFRPTWPERASIPLQLAQASLVLAVLGELGGRYPGDLVALLLAGGALQLLGLLVFLSERPRLWPRLFSFHELFHVLVVLGAGAHALAVFRFLAPGS